MKKYILAISIIFMFILKINIRANDFNTIKDFKRSSKVIQTMRKDIRKSIFVIKSSRSPELLPELKFYKYKVKKSDSIWKILSIASLNIDTLCSLNSLYSINDIATGSNLYFSNYRGILYKVNKGDSLKSLSKKFKIKEPYLKQVNKISKLNKKFIFIPCAKLSARDRSLLLSSGFINPLNSFRKTSGFGKRRDPFNRREIKFHKGVDLACPIGSSVKAARSGKVIFSGFMGGYGKLIIIKHNSKYSSYYGHLSKSLVRKGDRVKTGQIIAKSGNTGRSTGPHLHFEIRRKTVPIDPLSMMKKR